MIQVYGYIEDGLWCFQEAPYIDGEHWLIRETEIGLFDVMQCTDLGHELKHDTCVTFKDAYIEAMNFDDKFH